MCVCNTRYDGSRFGSNEPRDHEKQRTCSSSLLSTSNDLADGQVSPSRDEFGSALVPLHCVPTRNQDIQSSVLDSEHKV